MPRTLGTAISDEHDLILHPASDLLDALPWQRVRNLHTPRCEWMVGQPEAIGALPGKKFPLKLVKMYGPPPDCKRVEVEEGRSA